VTIDTAQSVLMRQYVRRSEFSAHHINNYSKINKLIFQGSYRLHYFIALLPELSSLFRGYRSANTEKVNIWCKGTEILPL
jgi:hypothetical protein